MAKQTKKLQQLIADLNSESPLIVSRAIKALEIDGNATVIKPIAELLLKGLPEKQSKEIVELLSSLKDSDTCVEIMEVITDVNFLSIRKKILESIWNMQVDFSSYIDDFVKIALEGDFIETLDCLTIIENLNGPFMEEDILECQLHIKNYLESTTPKDEKKAVLLSEIAVIIKDINESLMD